MLCTESLRLLAILQCIILSLKAAPHGPTLSAGKIVPQCTSPFWRYFVGRHCPPTMTGRLAPLTSKPWYRGITEISAVKSRASLINSSSNLSRSPRVLLGLVVLCGARFRLNGNKLSTTALVVNVVVSAAIAVGPGLRVGGIRFSRACADKRK